MTALGQDIRLFELDEAERMLPLVRTIVRGMMDDHAERQGMLEEIADETGTARARGLRREADALTEKLLEAASELAELGVEFKGVDLGLVDFPARRGGEIVYLCWQYGEDRIRFWHPLDAGYAGRQLIERG
ncbi:DUF2203 domain-containing protein [soil metagenome]